ncbi:protein phosphatase 2C domain-containing protein [Streptomyces sp. NPDC012693]|uniref:protein phosphatase 2C domain-containing protein n=1 Tax=unclassified Streptomyces TaxID=2593676 RepID=UPI00203059A5|nr:protein phosphatase 2C domain-containing protein [Streptomyces sp. MSC1_001]
MSRAEAVCVSRGANQPNEDYAAVTLLGDIGALVVLDGVGGAGAGCSHGVPWFTGRLGGELLCRAGTRPDLSLADCLAESIGCTADAHRASCDLTRTQTPQSTVVAARWDTETLEYLVLSDSMLLLQSPDLGVTAVLDKRLGNGLRNAEGGFHTAAAEPSVAARALTGSLPRSEVRALAAMTDGAGNWVETFGLGTWQDCVAVLEKEGPAGLVTRVRAAESTDLDRTAYRRDKPVDDAAVVYVRF